ncbi:MAG: protein kinase, partial [Clostridia bacterium]|nr:protein kinase [Clostridia bacterium]
ALPAGAELDGGSIVIRNKIGQGGFGITYLAYDKKKRQELVIKELYPSSIAVRQTDLSVRVDPQYRQNYDKALRSFIREARILDKLKDHPNIVRVFFYMKENNTAYYGMERLRGMDLRKYAEKQREATGRNMTAREAFDLLKPVMEALQFIHSRKVLHRDLSPDNIFMTEQGVPKLIDFGAAYCAIEEFTHTMANVKKNGFSPIEQVMLVKNMQGTWSDVYAFAATFYALIVGRPPLPAQDRTTQKLRTPREAGASISPEAEAVLLEGLAFDYRDRIKTISDFKRRLEAAIYGNASTAARVDLQSRPMTQPRPQPQDVPPELKSDVAAEPEDRYRRREEDSLVIDEEISGVAFHNERRPQGSGAGKRFLAYLIDSAVTGFAACLLPLILLVVNAIDILAFILLWWVFSFILMFGVGALLSIAQEYPSLGMLLVKLRLTTGRYGDEKTPGKAVLFSLLRAIPMFGLLAELVPCGNEKSLNEYIVQLRVAGDSEEQSISDIHKHADGDLSVISNVVDKPARPAGPVVLECVKGQMKGKTYTLMNGMQAGRGVTQGIQIPREDLSASGRHCAFVCEGGKWYLQDTSTNGTLINGVKLNKARSGELKNGVRIAIGEQEFILKK